MITKEKTTAEVKGRRVRFHEIVMTDSLYRDYSETNRWDEPMATANLVSSVDGKGLHRPALDIDLPVVVAPGEGSASVNLWIDVRCSDRAYRNLLQVLREFRIIDAGYTVGLDKLACRRQYAMDLKATRPTRPITDYMALCFGAWQGSFDQLLYKAAEETKPSRTDMVRGPAMKNPRMLPIFVDTYLVESSANYHLYLDTILSWDGYRRVLTALYKANIISRDWYKLSLRIQRTDLRTPWAQKNRPLGAQF